jgi:vacuole morphology and inheritance protein 14
LIYNNSDGETQETALVWVQEFLTLYQNELIEFSIQLIVKILPLLSSVNEKVRNMAGICNTDLFKIIQGADQSLLDLTNFTQMLVKLFLGESEPTKIASLDWMIMLHKKCPSLVFSPTDGTFPMLLKTFSESSDEVNLERVNHLGHP